MIVLDTTLRSIRTALRHRCIISEPVEAVAAVRASRLRQTVPHHNAAGRPSAAINIHNGIPYRLVNQG